MVIVTRFHHGRACLDWKAAKANIITVREALHNVTERNRVRVDLKMMAFVELRCCLVMKCIIQ